MREILFRAKRQDNGEWVYWKVFGTIVNPDTMDLINLTVVHNPNTLDEWEQYMVNRISLLDIDENTICEYTGLKDKNGTKIFEGDIIQGTITSQWNKRLIHCEVVFDNGCFISVETDGRHWSHKLKFAKDIEVIGNKFDNDFEVQYV